VVRAQLTFLASDILQNLQQKAQAQDQSRKLHHVQLHLYGHR
jgi:hypothetical protein